MAFIFTVIGLVWTQWRWDAISETVRDVVFLYFEVIVSERVKLAGTEIDFRDEGVQGCSNLGTKLMDCE